MRKWTPLKAAAVAALAASMTLAGSPARAGSTSIADPIGVDYTWDGATTDLRAVSLGYNAGVMTASWTVGGPLPAPGSTSPPVGGRTGVSYRVLFQNLDKHTGGDNPHGGCWTIFGDRKPDEHGSWHDGFHSFIDVDVAWEGSSWSYDVAVGEYDPAPGPDDGFVRLSPPATISVSGSTVTVEVDGVVESSDSLCSDGVFRAAYMTSGDRIVNVKGASTSEQPLILGSTVALSALLDFSDLSSVGAFSSLADVTAGNSTAGLFGLNKAGISYTPGLAGPDAIEVLGNCPIFTVGGVPSVLCYVDDDSISRGSFLPEWWDTPYGFTA